MHRRLLVAAFMFISSFMSLDAFAQTIPRCDAHEFWEWTGPPLDDVERYNDLICRAVYHMDGSRYLDAARAMEEALEISFHEAPNYALLTRLALAYFRAGSLKEANSNIRMAQLSLSIVSGATECVYGETDFGLRTRTSRGFREVPLGLEEEKTMYRMCGEALESYHGVFANTAFEDLRWIVEEISYYWSVVDEMERGQGDP